MTGLTLAVSDLWEAFTEPDIDVRQALDGELQVERLWQTSPLISPVA